MIISFEILYYIGCVAQNKAHLCETTLNSRLLGKNLLCHSFITVTYILTLSILMLIFLTNIMVGHCEINISWIYLPFLFWCLSLLHRKQMQGIYYPTLMHSGPHPAWSVLGILYRNMLLELQVPAGLEQFFLAQIKIRCCHLNILDTRITM